MGRHSIIKNPEAAGHQADVSPVPINIQPTDKGNYWPAWVMWPDWPQLWENSADPLDLKIAFIVDPKKAAQSAQLKLLTGNLLKRWGVGKGQQGGGEPQDQPQKGDPFGTGAIPKACGMSSGPPKGCGRSSGPPMSHSSGVTTRKQRGLWLFVLFFKLWCWIVRDLHGDLLQVVGVGSVYTYFLGLNKKFSSLHCFVSLLI